MGYGESREHYLSEGWNGTDLDQGADHNGTSVDHGVMGDSWGNTDCSVLPVTNESLLYTVPILKPIGIGSSSFLDESKG